MKHFLRTLALVCLAFTCRSAAADYLYVSYGGGSGPGGVSKYDLSNNYVTSFNGGGLLNNAAGIAQDLQGNVYVVNAGTNNIYKFDENGTLLGTISDSHLNGGPQGLAFDKFGNMYVSTYGWPPPSGYPPNISGQGSVQKFDSSGNWLAEFKGTVTHPIWNAQGLAVDGNGNLYVVDCTPPGATGNSVVILNSTTGAWVDTISTNINFPYGVAIDTSGNIYVSNGASHDVEVFGSNRQWLRTISGNMNVPIGVGIDDKGNLYTVNNGNNNVTVYNTTSGSQTATITAGLDGARWVAFKPYAVLVGVPEIDPAGMGSVLSLVLGSLGLLERRRRTTA